MISCQICSKDFFDSDILMDHMTEHIRESSYKSKVCNTANNSNISSENEYTSNKYNITNLLDQITTTTHKLNNENIDSGKFNNNLNDTSTGSEVSIKIEQLDIDGDVINSNELISSFGSTNKDTPNMKPLYVRQAIPYTNFTHQTNMNSEFEDLVNLQSSEYERKTIMCDPNKKLSQETCPEFYDTTEDNDLLTIKQEDLRPARTDSLNVYSNSDITGHEASSKVQLAAANNDTLLNTQNTFRSNDNRKANLQASIRSRINFDSDDEQLNLKDDADIQKDCLMFPERFSTLYPCDLCGDKFAHKHSLNIHKLKHSGKVPFLCDVCGGEFITKSALNCHKNQHDEKKHSCEICEKRFSSENVFKKHLEIHTALEKFECEFCETKFQFLYYLKRHMVVHTGEKRFSCAECDVSFRHHSGLSCHRENVHKTRIRHKCKICGKDYSSKYNLFKHNKYCHSDFQGYTCNICKKVFKYPSNFQRHMGIHNGYVSKFKCKFCDKCFHDNFHLERHQRRHTQEKPFQCDDCERKFKKKESLVYHIVNRICRDREPKRKNRKSVNSVKICLNARKKFKCNTCKNRYTTKAYLIKHICKRERQSEQKQTQF